MEVHARYTLMGSFALAVLAIGFLFAYWLEAGGGFKDRVSYRVQFDGSVAGLAKGSSVLFNGMRIGEVTGLALDKAQPSVVMVDISVERTAPVRADSTVTIEFQGLAGAPAVSLSGGTLASPLLAEASADKRRLTAEKNAGQSMTQAARDVLRKLDVLVADNTAAFTSAVANVDKFAAALARNSDKVDGIVSGIERLTGGAPKATPRIYELAAATQFAPITSVPKGQMQLPDPTSLSLIENERIVLTGGEKPSIENAQWPDLLPRVVQAALVRSFENAGYKRIFSRAPDGARTDYQLLIDIRRFQATAAPSAEVEVEIAARILKAEGTMTEVKTFRASLPVPNLDATSVADALGQAFRKVAAEIVVWACASI